ncbi:DmpA family aminopeptidase [Rhodovibrionaceae bacterium A322]
MAPETPDTSRVSARPRARDLGLPFPGTPGPFNAITDVPGVTVGFTTLRDPDRHQCTGVTAIVPRQDENSPSPVWAGLFALNGNGEMTGSHWIQDAGYFLGPICITNTHGVGAVHSGATRWMIERYSTYFAQEHAWAMPVVAETYDGVLNDINALFVQPEHAIAALNSARSGPVAEGAVGGGTGMIAYDFKAGTGTSSRQVKLGDHTYSLGVLVQANHGIRPWLTVLGVPVGQVMTEGQLKDKETGSIIVIVGTDAPLSALSLHHLAKRAGLGIGRSGTPGGNSSGDIFLAFSTGNEGPLPQQSGALLTPTHLNNELLDPLYLAAVEATDEAIINALVAGEDTPTFKPRGQTCRGIDTNKLGELVRTQKA